ncbi:ATP-binding protein [Streptomyces coffeae]|uniref:AAA family ATPase n=1 Tax=Streptomyces coffeae TaxID=621382 RepID=A0ABS1NA18_9ACTN|nr:AAA family ATPase [Streptomyces coffeae]MBL1096804.1 AAA family ATPase [Streptomyces coffeae]
MSRQNQARLTLLERESELGAVDEALTDLCGTRAGEHCGTRAGGVIAFAGPGGVGKTAVLAEMRRRAVARGCTVLSARGGEHEQGAAFHVVRQLFQPVLAATGEEEHRRILGGWYDIVAPAVGLVVSEGSGAPDPQGVRDGLDWLVTRFAVEYAPVVMILDDVHWADTESLDWLTRFAPRTVDLPLLLAVGYRPEDLSAEAAGVRGLTERQGSRPHVLVPLTPSGVGRIVRDVLGEEADDSFCRECWAMTGGNPFEVIELTAKIRDRELKPQSENLPALRELVSSAKDSGLNDRLTRLGTAAVRLAWAVAVLGIEATPGLSASVAGLSETEAADVVGRLVDARILAPPRGGPGKQPLEYLHPRIATAIYQAIPGALRVAMHGQAASVVLGAGLGSTAAGRHLLEMHPESDPWVVRHLRAAAREYLRAGAPDAGRRCLARALREPPALEERAAVLYELGCSAQLTEPSVTVNHLRAALEEPALDTDLREAITYRLAQAYGHSGRMEEAAQIVAAEAGRATSARTRLRMQTEQFMWNMFRADEKESPARSRRLARLADHLTGRGMAERYLLGLRAWDAMTRGEPAATALYYAEEALGDGLSWTDDDWGFEVPILVALIFLHCDQPGRAEDLFNKGIAECERKGWRGSHLAFGITLLGYARYRRGALNEAEELAREGMRIADLVGSSTPAHWTAVGTLIETLICRGRVQEAQEFAAGHGGEILPQAVLCPDVPAVRGELLLAANMHREARHQLTEVGRRMDGRGMRNPAWCPWQLHLSQALALTEPREAAEVADDAVRRARQFGTHSAIGRALHTAAAVAHGSERIKLLAEAVGHLERSPSAYDLAVALVDHGAALRRIGLPQEAGDRLYRGLEGAVQCGAEALATRARDELSAAGLRPMQLRVDHTSPLTSQEQAVAERAAQGWTDERICEETGLNDRDVARLLSGVYRKVGTDRTGLAKLLGLAATRPPAQRSDH